VGISLIERDFAGGDMRYSHSRMVSGGRLTVTGGLNVETMTDARKGFLNNNGAQGVLRRDEDNIARNFDQYLQAEWEVGKNWVLSGGLRHSEVRLESRDYFPVSGFNPDDSGKVKFTNTSPVLGVLYHLSPSVNLYANAGRGFETPTLIELAYATPSTIRGGLNLALQPSHSKNFEIGVKSFLGAATSLNLAVFKINTENEIVVDVGGARSTYKNAGATSRDGVELAFATTLLPNLDATFSYALLNATFDDAFSSSSGPVAAGNRIAGAPRNTAYGELAWKLPALGLTTALEARYTGTIKVNDINDETTESSTVANWRIAFEQKFGSVTLKEFARVENLADVKYVGGVNVNDTANKRYFAPAPGRNHLLGVSLAMAF
jgi:iron complex outermembrane receptor protein